MIGETYFHQQRYQRAREAYSQVIGNGSWGIWPARAALQAGKCWELEGRWEEAEKLYTDALQHQENRRSIEASSRELESAKELRARLCWVRNQTDRKR